MAHQGRGLLGQQATLDLPRLHVLPRLVSFREGTRSTLPRLGVPTQGIEQRMDLVPKSMSKSDTKLSIKTAQILT